MATEAFEFAFERRMKSCLVTGLDPVEGITLDRETSAWPLGVALQLEPVSVGTRAQWEAIQRKQGWIGARTFGLQMSLHDSRLRFEGVKPGLLPPGMYRASIFVGGCRFHHQLHEFTIPKNGTAVITAKEKDDNRRVRLDRGIDDFDAEIRRIVEASSIDGAGLTQWLADEDRRDSRKACALNLLAKLRTPIAGKAPLARGVVRLVFADVDRVYAELEPRFVARLMLPDSGFTEDPVIHSTHLRLLKFVPNGVTSQLHSLREHVETNSVQLALAIPDDSQAPQYADIDIDLGNPFTTPLGFIIHVGELIDPGKTDHINLWSKLKSSPVGEFLYYKVTEEKSRVQRVASA